MSNLDLGMQGPERWISLRKCAFQFEEDERATAGVTSSNGAVGES